MKKILEKNVKNLRKLTLNNFRFAEKSLELLCLTLLHYFQGKDFWIKDLSEKKKKKPQKLQQTYFYKVFDSFPQDQKFFILCI